jgi:hypothetical protein
MTKKGEITLVLKSNIPDINMQQKKTMATVILTCYKMTCAGYGNGQCQEEKMGNISM